MGKARDRNSNDSTDIWCYINTFKYKTIMIILIISVVIEIGVPVGAELYLTQEERDYIAEGNIIKASSIDGGAPLHYIDSKGEINGIAVRVLDKIADMTGLIFEYRLYDSIAEALKSDSDIFFGLTPQYAPDNMILSKPYLKTEAILFMNSSIDPNNLEDKKYASVKGGKLPEGIKEENTIYYDTREGTMEAVEKGKADYGYGNAYSLAYYILQNDYHNVVTIPKGKETREYAIGLARDDGVLLSIINRAINAIDDTNMQTLILDVASRVDRELTIPMIMDVYGMEVLGTGLLIVIVLLMSVISNLRANNRLKLQNRRYELLSNISNECIFEYNVSKDELELSNKCIELLGGKDKLDELTYRLKSVLLNEGLGGEDQTKKITLANDEESVFSVINSGISGKGGKLYSIVGKLTDISEEVAEKKDLLAKSQLDGLTGLYNLINTKELISRRMKKRQKDKKDAFIFIDCDNFKDVNDNYGHLVGDEVLKNIGSSLKLTFRESDIIGRIGGDEFCVYIHNVPWLGFIILKYKQLIGTIEEMNPDYDITISVGVAFVEDETSYEEVFKKAEKAMYQAKNNGRAQIVIYEKEKTS